MTRAGLDDARRMLGLLAQPGDVFELRGLVRYGGQQHVTSGFFDDIEALVRAALDRSGKDTGVYVTINPVLPALLSRAPKNRVQRAGSGDTTSDKDVRVRRSILVDVDPVRPAGISSSNDEHEDALVLTRRIRDELRAAGWPDPIFADSGNGGHLIYAVDLPVDDGGLVKRVLAELSKRYTVTGVLKIDEKVYNPARISKIYGTETRKGENTTERPHRMARLIEYPAVMAVVPRETLEAFAPSVATRPAQAAKPSNIDRPSFDLDAWLREHLPDANERPWESGRRWILPVCPLNEQHDRGEAYVTQGHGGAISAGCQHESCFKSWRELREHLEPEARSRREAYENRRNDYQNDYKNGNGHRLTDRVPPPEVLYQASDYSSDEAFADRDSQSFHDSVRGATDSTPTRPKWWRGPELVDQVIQRKDDPWITLKIADEEIAKVRAGGIVVVMGGPGSGKSSFVSNLLIEHARNAGPAIALSIELPADELAARIVGIQCDASWEQALRGQVERQFMEQALALPRLYVLDRKNATIENLVECARAVKLEYPGEPVLAAIDYAQLIQSKEREVRLRVTDAFERIDDAARSCMFVAIAVSQMSRASAVQAASGEKIGAESAALGAESAAIERFATLTLAIGKRGERRQDGTRIVELSIGKGRMSDQSDMVREMSYEGRTGRCRLVGEAKTAEETRTQRDIEKSAGKAREIRDALVGASHRAIAPLTREQLKKLVTKGSSKEKSVAIEELLVTGELVEVATRSRRSRLWNVWTLDRANATSGIQLVRDMPEEARG